MPDRFANDHDREHGKVFPGLGGDLTRRRHRGDQAAAEYRYGRKAQQADRQTDRKPRGQHGFQKDRIARTESLRCPDLHCVRECQDRAQDKPGNGGGKAHRGKRCLAKGRDQIRIDHDCAVQNDRLQRHRPCQRKNMAGGRARGAEGRFH